MSHPTSLPPSDRQTPTPPVEPAHGQYEEHLTPERRDFLRSIGVPDEMHEMLKHWGVGSLAVRMGIRFEELTPHHSVATMPVAGNRQPAGLLHGGAHAVLAETLGSFSAAVAAWPDGYAVGVDLNATHHRSVQSGTVRGTATAIQIGRRLVSHEIVMTDDEGRRLSTARITNMIIPFG